FSFFSPLLFFFFLISFFPPLPLSIRRTPASPPPCGARRPAPPPLSPLLPVAVAAHVSCSSRHPPLRVRDKEEIESRESRLGAPHARGHHHLASSSHV